MIGTERNEYLSSDNGEPSGTAGKPILGQINSFELTNIVIVVIRYFGGIKLGTSGLIVAYREAAKLAIEAGEILECHEQARLSFTFPYLSMNDVMKVKPMPTRCPPCASNSPTSTAPASSSNLSEYEQEWYNRPKSMLLALPTK